MNASRAVGLGPALRQAAFAPRSFVRRTDALRVVKRFIQTESLPASAAENILNKQRLNRPSSPHFTIYQPQITWIGSIVHRITGSGLSVLLYGFSLAYLVLPAVDIPFSSETVINAAASLPEGVKIAAKAILAAPFAFHSLNGLRHLAWDMNKFMNVKGAYRTGYAVVGATVISTIALLFM